MRLYNQSKRALSWSMGETRYECEPWGPVDVPDELVAAIKSRGVPLDSVAVLPELRAQVRIADEQNANRDAPLHALRNAASEAKAGEQAAKLTLDAVRLELDAVRAQLRESNAAGVTLKDQLTRAVAEKAVIEALLEEAGKQAAAHEERAIRSDALLAEALLENAKHEKPKPKAEEPKAKAEQPKAKTEQPKASTEPAS